MKIKDAFEANVNINISNELFIKYECLLFNYIDTYKIGFNDIFINQIQFIGNNNNLSYKLMFIKMHLFNYVQYLFHYQLLYFWS